MRHYKNELERLYESLKCLRCDSSSVEYEANDSTKSISFICTNCDWRINTTYGAAEAVGFDPYGRKKMEIILWNEQAEEVRKSEFYY